MGTVPTCVVGGRTSGLGTSSCSGGARTSGTAFSVICWVILSRISQRQLASFEPPLGHPSRISHQAYTKKRGSLSVCCCMASLLQSLLHGLGGDGSAGCGAVGDSKEDTISKGGVKGAIAKAVQAFARRELAPPKRARGHGLSGKATLERVRLMVKSRKLKAATRSLDLAKSAMGQLSASWDSTQLRLGDHAAAGASIVKQQRHRNQWDPHNMLKLAFNFSPSSRLPSSRYLDARSVVMQAALATQARRMERERTAAPTSWAVISRCFDEHCCTSTSGR